MPALPVPLNPIIDGGAGYTQASNTLQVICAFPVSGQYYVLVAACILARKSEWLRNACLAAALISPAIAAVHAIILAAVHVDGAVDLDIYGALQFCAIGVLAAPTTVRFSKTYFENKGLGLLFVWSLLILAGLLALAVEFFRTDPATCADDDDDAPITRASKFPYGKTTCGLVCSIEDGPHSPLRGGPAENIYVIPNIDIFPFGAATLFGGAVIAMIIFGELNFWSDPMMWETEPLTNASQWSGMASAVFAVFGSLYMLVAEHRANEPILPPLTPRMSDHHDWPDRPSGTAHLSTPCRSHHYDSHSNSTRASSLHDPHEIIETQPHTLRALASLMPMVRPESRESHLPITADHREEEPGLAPTPGRRSRANSFSSVMSRTADFTEDHNPTTHRPDIICATTID
ncbi:hypothetical protein VTJ49DRAFT_5056 [Mycothermus thermophilus]|uniref:Uncharacterized protein n=1 Tax=Humicola insolens TaxID=85995 RepID=A0ABR3V4Y1_HUMIN